MPILTWKNRIATQATTQTPEECINNITRYLRQHILNGVITNEQLIKIHNLAANPEQLKSALKWL